jgi:hypothetical protein
MQISKSFKNATDNLLNRQQAQILCCLLIQLGIGINIDMDLANGVWQEVRDNIQKVFFIILSFQEMTFKLNNI